MACMQTVERPNIQPTTLSDPVLSVNDAAQPLNHLARPLNVLAALLLLYGTALIFLQLEAPLKLLRGVLGYGGWLWGGLSDWPIAWGGPTDLDAPLRSLYTTLTPRQPLLPWLAWAAGALILIVANAPSTRAPSIPQGASDDSRATVKR